MGDDEIWMFDCLGLGNESRLLIVRVDEERGEARLVWEWRLHTLASNFGDCDPLPSGHVYGSFWRERVCGDESAAGVVEVRRDVVGPGDATSGMSAAPSDVTWNLEVFPRPNPDTSSCNQFDAQTGWKMYSVERFFEAPVIGDVGSVFAPRCDGRVLRFTAWNTFKQSHVSRGKFELRETATAAVLVVGEFDFVPYWRPTNVTAALSARLSATHASTGRGSIGVELNVTNTRGRSSVLEFGCASEEARSLVIGVGGNGARAR